jgi:hypothetical protein
MTDKQKEIDKLSEELVNNLVRLDMTYCFTSEEHDEMLRRIEALHNAAMNKGIKIGEK